MTAQPSENEIRSIVARWSTAVHEDRPPLILDDQQLITRMTPLLEHDMDFRDALLASACTVSPLDRIQDFACGVPSARKVANGMFTGETLTTDYIENADMICSGLANRMPNPKDKAMPTAMRGFLSWIAGWPERAQELTSEALELDPVNSLANVLMLPLSQHVAPPTTRMTPKQMDIQRTLRNQEKAAGTRRRHPSL